MSDKALMTDGDKVLRAALHDVKNNLQSLSDWGKAWASRNAGSISAEAQKTQTRISDHLDWINAQLVEWPIDQSVLPGDYVVKLSNALSKTNTPESFSALGGPSEAADGTITFAAYSEVWTDPSERAALDAEVNQLIESVRRLQSLVEESVTAAQAAA